jgi:ligand-binding sensor domain-containing protein
VADGDGFWVAGDQAVGWTRINGVPIRPLLVGTDLPGEVFDLAVDADFLWVATSGGLVRFRLSEVRP